MKPGTWAGASRLLAIEIGGLVADIRECKTDAELQACDGKLKALCALSASIAKTGALAGREGDALNLDGPKFQFLLREFVKSFEKSAADALGKGHELKLNKIMKQLNKIMKQIDDQIEAAMPQFRCRIETIGLDTGTDTSKGMEQKNRSERSE
jgi:hypothetical protein